MTAEDRREGGGSSREPARSLLLRVNTRDVPDSRSGRTVTADWGDIAGLTTRLERAGLEPVVIFGRSRRDAWVAMSNGIMLGPIPLPAAQAQESPSGRGGFLPLTPTPLQAAVLAALATPRNDRGLYMAVVRAGLRASPAGVRSRRAELVRAGLVRAVGKNGRFRVWGLAQDAQKTRDMPSSKRDTDESGSRTCPGCGASLLGRRSDCAACSPTCRKRAQRLRATGLAVEPDRGAGRG